MKRFGFAAAFVGSLVLVMTLGTSREAVAEGDGKAVFEAQKCSMCHSVQSIGIEAKTKSAAMAGPDLSKVERSAEEISKFLRKEAQINEKDHKKEVKLTDEEMNTLVEWLRSAKS